MAIRALILILLVIWGTFVARSEETSPRLAVVPESFDPALAAFGDLLTAELSTSPQKFALVERAELQRLSQEQSLQSMNAAARPIALARLAKADGLVFLGKDATDPKKPCFNVRLAACGNGLILRSLRLSAEEKEMATAAKLAAEALGFSADSLAMGKTEPVLISLLGLRSAAGSYDPATTALNAALAHQLSSRPGVIVLERWKLDDVVFERTLSAKDQPQLATGTTLVDGSFRGENGVICATVRLRNPNDTVGETVEIRGQSEDFGQVAKEIAYAIGTRLQLHPAPSFDTRTEAEHYATLGGWLYARDSAVEAAQAFESAVALGDDRRETLIHRLRAYAKIVNPGMGIEWYVPARNDDYGVSQRTDADFHLAVVSAIRVASDLLDLAKADWPGFERQKKRDDRFFLTRGGLEIGEQTLQAICLRPDGKRRFADEAALLRSLCRELVNVGIGLQGESFNGDDVHVGYLHDTPEQAVLAYRKMLDASRLSRVGDSPGSSLRYNFWAVSRKPVQPEKVIDWEEKAPGHAGEVWQAFVSELARSTSSLPQIDALAFQYEATVDPAERDRILGKYCELLEKNTDWFTTPDGQRAALVAFGIHWINPDTLLLANAPRFNRLLLSLYQRAGWLERDVHYATSRVFQAVAASEPVSRSFSEPLARQFLKVFAGYLERARSDARWQKANREEILAGFDELRVHLFKAYPGLATEGLRVRPAVEGAVPLHAWLPGSPTAKEREWLDGEHLCWDGRQLLMPTASRRIWTFDPVAGKVDSFPCPEHFGDYWSLAAWEGRAMVFTDRLAYADYRSNPVSWCEIPAPALADKSVNLSACGDSFYVGTSTRSTDRKTFQTLLGQWRNGKLDWIVSSNRAPEQHPLDAKRPRGFLHAFTGYAGEAVALFELPLGKHHAYQLSKGDFLGDLNDLGRVQRNGEMALHWQVYEDNGTLIHVIGFDPKQEKPILLLRNAKPGGYAPLREGWEKQKPLADFSRPEFRGEIIAPIVHGGRLWLLKWDVAPGDMIVRHNADDLRLVGVSLTTGKCVVVPLRYNASNEVRAIKGDDGLDMANPLIDGRSLTASSYGLHFTVRGRNERGYRDRIQYSPAMLQVRWDEVNTWIAQNAPEFLAP